jgi:hypothetical protein
VTAHWVTDRVGARCACGIMPGRAHFVAGESAVFCEACCPECNRKPVEPTEPMQAIGKTISGVQEKLI